MTPKDFIAAIGPAAQASMRASKIPASFTIAQAALESGWGTSKTAINAKNLFNIKADPSWKGPTWSMASEEHLNGKDVVVPALWRMYPNWQACFDDRSKFFATNNRYKNCYKAVGGEAWARAVAAAGFATDPNYAAKLIAVIRTHYLITFDQ